MHRLLLVFLRAGIGRGLVGLALGLGLGGVDGRGAEAATPVAVAMVAGSTGVEPSIRGVVISCQTWGHEWGSDAMVAALAEVKALGANWEQMPKGSGQRWHGVKPSNVIF